MSVIPTASEPNSWFRLGLSDAGGFHPAAIAATRYSMENDQVATSIESPSGTDMKSGGASRRYASSEARVAAEREREQRADLGGVVDGEHRAAGEHDAARRQGAHERGSERRLHRHLERDRRPPATTTRLGTDHATAGAVSGERRRRSGRAGQPGCGRQRPRGVARPRAPRRARAHATGLRPRRRPTLARLDRVAVAQVDALPASVAPRPVHVDVVRPGLDGVAAAGLDAPAAAVAVHGIQHQLGAFGAHAHIVALGSRCAAPDAGHG